MMLGSGGPRLCAVDPRPRPMPTFEELDPMRLVRFGILGSVVLACLVTLGLKKGDTPGTKMHAFADSFIESLDAEQKAAALVAYDSETRTDWHFIPKKTRKGAVLREMNAAQKTAALRLLRAGLSEAGYGKADQIMQLEGVLAQLQGEGGQWERDPNKYYVTIFGTPSKEDAWGLSFEGHHLSLNFVCRDGKIVDSSPQFFAANPATIMNDVEGPLGKGTRVLRDEEQLAFDLVNSLNDKQIEKAVIAEKAPKEIRFAGEAQSTVGEPEGILVARLDDDQKQLLRRLVRTYSDSVPGPVAAARRKLIAENGWGKIHFAWAGAKKPGIGHYYRIRGNSFLIEFVNTQADAAGNPANHIHAVWRDLNGDFDLPIK